MNDMTKGLACPLPWLGGDTVLMAHGGGGRAMRRLIDQRIAPVFQSDASHDGAILDIEGSRLAFTTDSYVVTPLFFSGGDIGKLAVFGTVNDLAMCGAEPLALSVGFILEEGLPLEILEKITHSMAQAARQANVRLVTGDTKVVGRGKGDGLYINTAGVGVLKHSLKIAPHSIRPGDAILLSGDVGRHGISILAEREGLSFESTLESDCAALAAPVLALIAAGLEVHCLRDLTRGGLTSALIELAESAGLRFEFQEALVPVCDAVRGACALFGFDPMQIANEGRFVCFLPEAQTEQALAILAQFQPSQAACRIGAVLEGVAKVVCKNQLGVGRILLMPDGEPLPRIC